LLAETPVRAEVAMHLARRAYLLALLTAVLAIAAIWSQQREVGLLGEFSLALLLSGLALEGLLVRRASLQVRNRHGGARLPWTIPAGSLRIRKRRGPSAHPRIRSRGAGGL